MFSYMMENIGGKREILILSNFFFSYNDFIIQLILPYWELLKRIIKSIDQGN